MNATLTVQAKLRYVKVKHIQACSQYPTAKTQMIDLFAPKACVLNQLSAFYLGPGLCAQGENNIGNKVRLSNAKNPWCFSFSTAAFLLCFNICLLHFRTLGL